MKLNQSQGDYVDWPIFRQLDFFVSTESAPKPLSQSQQLAHFDNCLKNTRV
jgi:hypothetical protein